MQHNAMSSQPQQQPQLRDLTEIDEEEEEEQDVSNIISIEERFADETADVGGDEGGHADHEHEVVVVDQQEDSAIAGRGEVGHSVAVPADPTRQDQVDPSAMTTYDDDSTCLVGTTDGRSTGLLDQLNTTQDSYLYFARAASHDEEETSYFSIPQQQSWPVSEEQRTPPHHYPTVTGGIPLVGEEGHDAFPTGDNATTAAALISVPQDLSAETELVNTTSSTIYVGDIIYSDLSDAEEEDSVYDEVDDDEDDDGRRSAGGSAGRGEPPVTPTRLSDDDDDDDEADVPGPVNIVEEQQSMLDEQLGAGEHATTTAPVTENAVTVMEQPTQTGPTKENDNSDDGPLPLADLDDGLFTGTLNTQTRVTQSSPQNIEEGRRVLPATLIGSLSLQTWETIIPDIENQHDSDGEDGNTTATTGLMIAQSDNVHSAFDAVAAIPRRSRDHEKEQSHRRRSSRQRMSFPELPYVDAKMDYSENNSRGMGDDHGDNDSSDFMDSRSNLSDDNDEGTASAMAWTGTVWGLPRDNEDDATSSPPSKGRISGPPVVECLLIVALYGMHTMTSHWPPLVALLHWDRTPSLYAAPLVFGMITLRWMGHRRHQVVADPRQRWHQLTDLAVATVGFALWAWSDMVRDDSLMSIGLLLASAHEPMIPCPMRMCLKPIAVAASYLLGGILYEVGGSAALGGAGTALLFLQAIAFVLVGRYEKDRPIASNLATTAAPTQAQAITPNKNDHQSISAVAEGDEKCTTCVSWVHKCSLSAIHGLITTSAPWLVTLEYGWTNVILLGALFAGAAALAPIAGTLISPRMSVYATTYALLAAGLPYRWSFVAGFLLLPSCLGKAVPSTPSPDHVAVVDTVPFVAYLLAASSAPLLYVQVMPHAPAVAACVIAFVASVVEFVTRNQRKEGREAERNDVSSIPLAMTTPTCTGLWTLQKTLF